MVSRKRKRHSRNLLNGNPGCEKKESYNVRKLFSPFRDILTADAHTEGFDADVYFEETQVEVKTTGEVRLLREELLQIMEQVVLEGESGFGKTMFLKNMVRKSKGIIVYLSADRCEKEVIEAIQEKLHGYAKDQSFLKKLIYSRAIDICIDGLNEVTAETRASITKFAESFSKGNIIITT